MSPRSWSLAAGSLLLAQYLPSAAVLGQWGPWRAAPFGLCRWQGPPKPSVALTFDDGPDPKTTPAFLEALDRLELQATFFCLGEAVVAHPEMLAEILARGHEVETHGYYHRHHLGHSPRWIAEDLRHAVASLEERGVSPRYYRPTYGQATGTTLLAARALGLVPVLWSAWGREWVTHDETDVVRRIGRRLGPGAIVLLHDTDAHGAEGMWRTGLRALEVVAAELKRRKLTTSSLKELLEP